MHFILCAFLVQTDMMDLLGSDLPVESDEGVAFSWSDGILLQVEYFCIETCDVDLCFCFDMCLICNLFVSAGPQGRLLGFAGRA